jgi:hypothetical protein
MTLAGVALYRGTLPADGHEIVVTGNLPRGETTQSITYWIVDSDTNAIVSQVILPDRSNQFSRVEMPLKVARAANRYQIGTFAATGAFEPAGFLSVHWGGKPSPSSGPIGATA